MKKRIKEKIERTREFGITKEMVVPVPQPAESKVALLLAEAVLARRVEDLLKRLPLHKDLFTPQEVAFAFSRSGRWVRERFRKNPLCFNVGSGSKVYLSIPRDVVAEEFRKMARSQTIGGPIKRHQSVHEVF